MSVKQNPIDFAMDYPLAVDAVNRAFYVDDRLTGADSTEEAIELQKQLQDQFFHGGFLLRKWNSNDQMVLQHIPPEVRDPQSMYTIPDSYMEYVKTLGVEWNTNLDHFCLTVAKHLPIVLSPNADWHLVSPKLLMSSGGFPFHHQDQDLIATTEEGL